MRRIAIPGLGDTFPLALGMADHGTRIPAPEAHRLTDVYLEAGGRFLDTAHIYASWWPGGEAVSERFIGEVLRRVGSDGVFVATKGGHVGIEPWYRRPDRFLTPELVRQDLSESLDRLGLDRVSVYYLHRDDPRIPAEELIELLNEVAGGVATVLGASNWSGERVLAANRHALAKGWKPFSIVQNQGSLALPNWKVDGTPGEVRYFLPEDVAPLREAGVTPTAYSATANGFFAGSQAGTYDSPENHRRRERVQELAEGRGVSPTAVALAWLVHAPHPILPIVGTGSEPHLREALEGAQLDLSTEERATLDPRG